MTLQARATVRRPRLAAALLYAGVVGGVLITVTSCLLAALRPGFDVRRHPNSLLVLGDWGWVQTVDIVLYGSLLMVFGFGVGRATWPQRSGVVAAAGLVVYGLGAGVIVGLNPPAPAFGFPPGTSGSYPGYDELSTTAKIHGIGGMIGFLAVTVACFAFTRYFAGLGDHRWAVVSALAGLSVLAVCAYLGANASRQVDEFDYTPTWLGSVVLWLYISAVAGRLLVGLRR